MRESPALYAFNRGIVSPLGLARTDQKRVSLSAEVMSDWIPRVLGSMSLRPGWQYIGATNNNASPRGIPFVFATDDTARAEFTDGVLRIWIDDVLLSRTAVSTAITNGTFAGNITGWTDNSDGGGAIAWDTGNYLKLTGNGIARAIAYQNVVVTAGDLAKEHGLRVIIARGPVRIRIGASAGSDEFFSDAELDTGEHSLAFTPTSNFYVLFYSSANYKVQIQQCSIEAAGTVAITSPYTSTDLNNIRYDQSADVIFLACAGFAQRKIERRGTRPGGRSWSLALYQVNDGPFKTQNFTPTTLTASGLTGDITLTASTPLFASTNVGGLYRLINQVSGVSVAATAQDTWSSGLKVTGSGTTRSLTITLTGTWVAKVKLQVSTDNSSWSDVPGGVWGGNVSGPYLDGLDGQTRYYRIGVATGDFTSGTVNGTLTFTSGTLAGVVRITAYTSNTSVSAQVLSDIGSTSATAIWSEGSWSSRSGYPTSIKLHEGRLWWAGQNGLFGSISDNYYSYDENFEGDAGAINRTIGSGPVDVINNIVSLQRMILMAQGAEYSVKSSAFDTPLTPTDFTIKAASTQGSTNVDSVRIDQRAAFVDRSGIKVFELVFDLQTYEYSSNDLTAVVPELGLPKIVRIGLQRKPDTRIHCVRSDGTVMLAVLDKVEDVLAWVEVNKNGDGEVVDVVVLPGQVGSTEDQVYYAVRRTVNGSSVCYWEKWAKETECRGGTLNKQAESFIVFTNSPASTTVAVPHLVGEDVVVWQDGFCPEDSDGVPKTFTVSASGTIALDTAATTGVVGLSYISQWQSSKLGLQQSLAEAMLNQHKKLSHLGVVGAWLHPKGIKFGPDFDNLDDMPAVEGGTAINQNTVRTQYDEEPIPFPGTWDTDARLCIQAQAPRPATLLALIPDMEMHS